MGVTWFWAYKLRIMKIAHRQMRVNPFRSLMMSLGVPALPDLPGVSVGSPMTDNFVTPFIAGGLAGSDPRLRCHAS
ncbi:hypothetical protein [Salipiger mucosus]|uniref:Uncharacterized protein n=1 Tax=Salipiger mucosus DSM 16094 TaxID=1123237 RepID=S9Q7T3_9RHOB|nr:hypothetical protein [Salipiger mucosus]EPX75648.1 hypothetical protein Salmuc_04566 [Salipiger mucosus DSM 16094]